MLAERSSHFSVLELINNAQHEHNKYGLFLETKFDGERMQIHYSSEKGYRYFSRRGFDYTASYGPSKEEGLYTPILNSCLNIDVQSFILDGEMVGYHIPTSTIGHKGPDFDIKYISEHSEYQICYAAFDLLYLNGKILTSQPLKDRKTLLTKKFKPKIGYFFVVQYESTHTETEIMKRLSQAIDAREEGLMLKDPFSRYKPNVRNGGGWFKLKPDYVAGLMDSLDLLIVGAYYKTAGGRRNPKNKRPDLSIIKDLRNKLITHFALAVRVTSQDSDIPDKFLPVCVVGSGFSNQELFELLNSLSDSFKPNSHHHEKHSRPYTKGNRSGDGSDVIPKLSGTVLWELRGYRPDVVIDPNDSIVLQVKVSEVIVKEYHMNESNKTGMTDNFNVVHDKGIVLDVSLDVKDEQVALEQKEECDKKPEDNLSKIGNRITPQKRSPSKHSSKSPPLFSDHNVSPTSKSPHPHLNTETSFNDNPEFSQDTIKIITTSSERHFIDEFKPVLDPTKFSVRLRFPRLESVRYDKSWDECMTLEEIVSMDSNSNKQYREKLSLDQNNVKNNDNKFQPLGLVAGRRRSSRFLQHGDNFTQASKTVSGKRKRKRSIVSHSKPLNTNKAGTQNDIQMRSTIFEGQEFNIINGIGEFTKADLERLCLERGAKIVQIPGLKTSCLIAGHVNVKVTNFLNSKKYDIVKASWLLRCVDEKRLLKRTPSDFIYMASSLTTRPNEPDDDNDFDKYGDHYTRETSPKTLSKLVLNMSPAKCDVDSINQSDLDDLKSKLLA